MPQGQTFSIHCPFQSEHHSGLEITRSEIKIMWMKKENDSWFFKTKIISGINQNIFSSPLSYHQKCDHQKIRIIKNAFGPIVRRRRFND